MQREDLIKLAREAAAGPDRQNYCDDLCGVRDGNRAGAGLYAEGG